MNPTVADTIDWLLGLPLWVFMLLSAAFYVGQGLAQGFARARSEKKLLKKAER